MLPLCTAPTPGRAVIVPTFSLGRIGRGCQGPKGHGGRAIGPLYRPGLPETAMIDTDTVGTRGRASYGRPSAIRGRAIQGRAGQARSGQVAAIAGGHRPPRRMRALGCIRVLWLVPALRWVPVLRCVQAPRPPGTVRSPAPCRTDGAGPSRASGPTPASSTSGSRAAPAGPRAPVADWPSPGRGGAAPPLRAHRIPPRPAADDGRARHWRSSPSRPDRLGSSRRPSSLEWLGQRPYEGSKAQSRRPPGPSSAEVNSAARTASLARLSRDFIAALLKPSASATARPLWPWMSRMISTCR